MPKTIPAPRRALPLCFALTLALLCSHSTAQAMPVAGLTTNNELILFDTRAPGSVFSRAVVSGLKEPGEALLGIDLRPSNNRLYAVSDRGLLYVVDPVTGAATQISGSPISPALNLPGSSAREIGFDIDPVRDQIRVLTCTQNLRIDPDTGAAVASDAAPAYAPGQPDAGQGACLRGAAYSNNFRNASSSTLYALDVSRGLLATVGSPGGAPSSADTGLVFKIGDLPIIPPALAEQAAFDVAPGTADLAFAALTGVETPVSVLFSVNLSTRVATRVGFVGGAVGRSFNLRGMALLQPGAYLYAVTASNKLLLLHSAVPGAPLFAKTITGMRPNEFALAIDFRPATGQLYALGSTSLLYRLDATTAVADEVSNGGAPAFPAPTGGAEFGFDFNPVTDRLRVISDAGQNVRLNPDTGAVEAVDPAPAYASDDPNAGRTPKIVGAAYANNVAGAASTTLYGIDYDRQALVKQDATGALRTVGPLELFLTSRLVGFDIAAGNVGYAALTPLCFEGCPAPSVLALVDLNFGRASNLGFVGGGEAVRGLAAAPANVFFFTNAEQATGEGHHAVRVTVAREGDTSTPASVDYATSDGTASERSDYNAALGTLRFAAGETAKTFDVLINDDSHLEEPEIVTLTLSKPSGGFALGFPAVSTVVINSQPQELTFNPIDNSFAFVHQHYHDFLNRVADSAGHGFWGDNIESCGADQSCRGFKRVETSAAFFLSVEFQQTGYLVYRLHETAFDTGERLRLRDFLRDTQEIGRGVVVNTDGWHARLEANKRALVEEFVTRPAFLAEFPAAMSAAQFVDKLDANAGHVLSSAERENLINGLNENRLTRAEVLRGVAEDSDLFARERNRAFVLMQYFGYLRRNPDDSPDDSFAGYDFWLQKLNQFGGDFRRAEMVKAFITSGEYRRRFGPQ